MTDRFLAFPRPRRMPRVPLPVPGESFTSWVDAVARDSRCYPNHLLTHAWRLRASPPSSVGWLEAQLTDENRVKRCRETSAPRRASRRRPRTSSSENFGPRRRVPSTIRVRPSAPGEGKVSVPWIVRQGETTVSRAALYAALSGTRLPKRETVSTLVRWWAGNPLDELDLGSPELDDPDYYVDGDAAWFWIHRLPSEHEDRVDGRVIPQPKDHGMGHGDGGVAVVVALGRAELRRRPHGARVLGPPDNPPVVRAGQDCPGWP